MRFFLPRTLSLACVVLGIQAAEATSELYINSGSVTNPIVDATGFLNEGSFQTSTSIPYETSNTLNYTNRGTISGGVGFRFHTFTNGFRRRANNFVNETYIEATESTFINSDFISSSPGSYLYINSTNITNPGFLGVGSTGLLRIDGNRVNLRGAGILAGSSSSQNFFSSFPDSVTQTNYSNESKISDRYWGVGTNGAFTSAGSPLNLNNLVTSTNSGSHQIVQNFGQFFFTNFTSIPQFSFGTEFQAFAFTNPVVVGGTSQVIQVVFVATNSFETNMNVDVKFFGNGRISRPVVEFSVDDVDVLTGAPLFHTIYFSDSALSALAQTNFFLQDNRNNSAFRPNAYDVTTVTPFNWEFGNGQSANTPYTPGLLYDNAVHANAAVDYVYSAYGINITSTTATNNIIDPSQLEPTNSLGRVEVYADELNLNLARIRTEGLLTLRTTNLIALNEGATLDVQQVHLNLATTNRELVIANLLSGDVKRLVGDINAWTAVWTNQTSTGMENIYHVLMLENQMTSVQPMTTYSFTGRATNQPNGSVILMDPANITRDLLIDADNFVIQNRLTVTADLDYRNWPRLQNFTNEGFIEIPGNANFSRQNGPLLTFVNRTNSDPDLQPSGFISANGQLINTLYFENSGILTSRVGSISISNVAGTAELASGMLASTLDVRLVTDLLRTSNSVITAGSITTNLSGQPIYSGGLFITADRLADSGETNVWQTFNGFKLLKASSEVGWEGDLLGTRLSSSIRPSGVVPHQWSSFDLGAVPAGFSNNAALGYLVLNGANFCRYQFSSASAGVRALYVDYLELQNYATNFQTALEIDPNFRIYFADCNIPPEKLHNTHQGRLQWVRSYAGRNSSTNIWINGQWITINRALVQSKEIDSDGDGTPNGMDSSPFDGVTLTASSSGSLPFLLSWQAAADTSYTVEFTDSLSGTNTVWTELTNVTPAASGPVTVQDSEASNGRLYRVRYTP